MIVGMYVFPGACPLSLHRHLAERSSPSRGRFAAQTQRALDRSGPFPKLTLEKGKGANTKSRPRAQSQLRTPKLRCRSLDDVNNLQA